MAVFAERGAVAQDMTQRPWIEAPQELTAQVPPWVRGQELGA